MAEKRSSSSQVRMPGPMGGPPRHHMIGTVEKAEDVGGVARRLWGYLRRYRAQLILVFCLVAGTTGLTLLNPYLISLVIDRCILPRKLEGLAQMAGLMVLAYLLTTATTWGQTVAMIHISQRTVRDLRRDLFGALHRLSLRFFDQNPHGELMSRLTNDTENVSNTLSQTVAQLMTSVLSILGTTVVMIALNWRLALVNLVTVPFALVMTHYIAKATRQGFRDRQRDLGVLNGVIEETITGERVVKVFRGEGRVIEQFGVANDNLRVTATRAGILVGVMGPCMGLVRNSGFALLAAVGGWMVAKGWATLGTVAAFFTYAQQFSRPLYEIANLYGTVQSAVAGAERVFAVIDEEPDMADDADAVHLTDVKGEVLFDDVCFGYAPGVPVLQHVSLEAAPGQTIALVGPTGAGKTTIINLLTRFYDVDSGRILVDGHDIRHVRRDDLRRALGVVLQDMVLFAATVRENIRYGRLDATDAEVEAAAKMANADGFIRRLPQGYETPLSEAGSSLSQGQRQLLAIARAVLANPSILILDEATSSVDTRTEIHIQEAMLRLMEGRTSFVIAHRLSTIREADCILVIDGGRVVERGTHEELIAAQGVYYDLHRSQFGLAAREEQPAAVVQGSD
ncbi:ABC transporter ATP-binding protein/permease [bacterium]|nr:ABC transporter ATP-binding protein/permease [bacterium]